MNGNAQICPVCLGRGMVSNGFYSSVGTYNWSSTSTEPETCRSCDGRGVVFWSFQEEYINYIQAMKALIERDMADATEKIIKS